MNVSLTPDLTRRIEDRVETGLYTSASEVVREALRLLFQVEQARTKGLEEFSNQLAIGLAQSESGKVLSGEEALARSKARIASRRTR